MDKLISFIPLEADQYEWAWLLLSQFPKANLDDSSPKNVVDFGQEIDRRKLSEEIYQVLYKDQPIGYIGFIQITPRLGWTRGIAFDKSQHHSGIPELAVRMFLQIKFKLGLEKLCIQHHADNRVVNAFLKKLGAVDQGYMHKQITQDGKPIDIRLLAIFNPQFQ